MKGNHKNNELGERKKLDITSGKKRKIIIIITRMQNDLPPSRKR
jgi:hypothetical protein